MRLVKPESSNKALSLFHSSNDVLTSFMCTYKLESIVRINLALVLASSAAYVIFPLTAHPNCILFVTHGGLLSTTESVHFGVPIIGIPVAGDQHNNVKKAVHKGFALEVELSYDTPKDLKSAIEEVLRNPSYRERVKYLSLVYHDRPVPPAKEMVHWVEHTVKTRGAPHLRSRALTTPWYQKMYLDLVALVAAIILGLYFTAKRLFKKKSSITSSKKYN
ncbi:UDP-glucuronosyltransferase 2B15 [Eumeta japonica]|uniref:UDP-glucuronosyltransferase 2B15 n=1 Tax=Eumeta variegata TaxID=151549 RepID=A0A4C1VWI0_EUMVA|nr:UDP-glucuronosyltransferase 2B15 [Eumeta japonica]